MQIYDLSKENSIVNQFMAELRDADYQRNRLLFRNNIMRIGEMMAYEISKKLDYAARDITTPLGTSRINLPADDIVLATILRAGLPFHTGFLNVFDTQATLSSAHTANTLTTATPRWAFT